MTGTGKKSRGRDSGYGNSEFKGMEPGFSKTCRCTRRNRYS
nr:MAG TPA: hypothetical protein [Caudoviricetes sp.]